MSNTETKPSNPTPPVAKGGKKPKVKRGPVVKKSSGEKAKPESRSHKANITFPVSRIDRLLRDGRFAPRVESTAPVYLAAVLEYLVYEILELAHNICNSQKKTRITPQHINWAVGNDQELNTLFSNVTIANGGVLPVPTQDTRKSTTKKSTKKASAEASQSF
ncbi:H2AX, histone H2A [Tieghemostelium lacteum]|uniref:Histone H2A n=1 Tax=Tieghemostelium lacteum TaxID=361077 RepID=A0A152A5V1_TIELA|nr:H2AX, histone H2A [Tieghemostelium lacteum]|eukprot:KYR01600.1 H2AX, histone H2A [Tieghemostelium lacteum]